MGDNIMPSCMNREADSLGMGGLAGGVFGWVTWGIGFATAAPIGIGLFAGVSLFCYCNTEADDNIETLKASTVEKDKNNEIKKLKDELQVMIDKCRTIDETLTSMNARCENLEAELPAKNRELQKLQSDFEALQTEKIQLLKENSQLASEFEAQGAELEELFSLIKTQLNPPANTIFQGGLFHRHTTQTAASATNTPAQRVSSLRT